VYYFEAVSAIVPFDLNKVKYISPQTGPENKMWLRLYLDISFILVFVILTMVITSHFLVLQKQN
jgi:hypothetical protein